MTEYCSVEKDNHIMTVTLERPDRLNALHPPANAELGEVFDDFAADDDMWVAIITGEGRGFSAGNDLRYQAEGGERVPTPRGFGGLTSRFDLPKPVIAAVNGVAMGGGFEIALMCDFLIASSAARFADTHARVGVVPGWGLSQRLPRLIGINRAKELSLTGNYLDADTAYAWGLVNRVVPADELLPTCKRLAHDILSTEPVTRGEIRRIMDAGWHGSLAEGLELEAEASRAHGRAERPSEQVASRRAQIQARGRDQAES